MKLKKYAGRHLDKYTSSELVKLKALIDWEIERRERNFKRLGGKEHVNV